MEMAVSEAKAQLLELVRRAETGEEVILTRNGRPVVRLTPVIRPADPDQRRAMLTEMFGAARREGPGAARSQDFLYDDKGMPL